MNHYLRIRRRIRRHLEVAGAALRGFRYRTSIGAPVAREALHLVGRVFALRRKTVDRSTWRRRFKTCRKCPLYDPKNRTCGNNEGLMQFQKPGSDALHLAPNGCSCKVGVKASNPKEDCFLASIGLPSQWGVYNIKLDE